MIKNKKVKKFISICLCMILLFGMGVQQTFAEGENSEVEKSEEIIQDEQDVADKNITIDNEHQIIRKKIQRCLIRKFLKKIANSKRYWKSEKMK